jgi:hypothetical protein
MEKITLKDLILLYVKFFIFVLVFIAVVAIIFKLAF